MTTVRQIWLGLLLLVGYAAATLLWLVIEGLDTLAAWRGKR